MMREASLLSSLHVPPANGHLPPVIGLATVAMEVGLSWAGPILIGLCNLAGNVGRGFGERIAHLDRALFNSHALGAADIVFDETEVQATVRDAARVGRNRVFADMRLLARVHVDQGAGPGRAARVADREVVCMLVVAVEDHAATHARSAVRAITAVFVVGGGPLDEGGEDATDGGAFGLVLLRLQACVSDVVDAEELELMRVVVALLVGAAGDGHGEDDILEAGVGDVFHFPAPTDHAL